MSAEVEQVLKDELRAARTELEQAKQRAEGAERALNEMHGSALSRQYQRERDAARAEVEELRERFRQECDAHQNAANERDDLRRRLSEAEAKRDELREAIRLTREATPSEELTGIGVYRRIAGREMDRRDKAEAELAALRESGNRTAAAKAEAKIEAAQNWRCIGPESPDGDCRSAPLNEMCVACAAHELTERAEKAEAERDAVRADAEATAEQKVMWEAENARLREALERETVEVSMERTWCRTCRTENRSRERSRSTHPHAKECVLFRAALAGGES